MSRDFIGRRSLLLAGSVVGAMTLAFTAMAQQPTPAPLPPDRP
jgi:hypothetical protein